MFLDSTYFQGELSIPNLRFRDRDVVGVAAVAIQATGETTLEWFVEKYEREFLVHLLGLDLYERFIAGLDPSAPGHEYFEKLRDVIFVKGKQFSYSPAANYVYYWLTRDGRTQPSGVGEVRAKVDSTEIVSGSSKLTKAWNDMGREIEAIHAFICSHEEWFGKLHKTCHCWFRPINSFNL